VAVGVAVEVNVLSLFIEFINRDIKTLKRQSNLKKKINFKFG
jgi:hypothetical protein